MTGMPGHAACPAEHRAARFLDTPPIVTVVGPFAEFNHCHPSVEWVRTDASKPTFILLHGGGGGDENYTRALAGRLNREGFNTLVFDAYKMNGLYRDTGFWARKVYTPPKQAMMFFTGLGAYEWLRDHAEVTRKAFYVYGVSSGATAAINIAAVGDPASLKGVFAEGPPAWGIGLPDRLSVPVHVLIGDRDNYFSHGNEKLWQRREKCSWSSMVTGVPRGTASTCSFQNNKSDENETLEEYIRRQQARGYEILVKEYPNAGHAFFWGDIKVFTYPDPANPGKARYATLGANESARTAVIRDLVSIVNRE